MIDGEYMPMSSRNYDKNNNKQCEERMSSGTHIDRNGWGDSHIVFCQCARFLDKIGDKI